MTTKARRQKVIDRLICRRQKRLIELFGPQLALAVDRYLDRALSDIAQASIILIDHDKDDRDLLILFTEVLNDTHNTLETLP